MRVSLKINGKEFGNYIPENGISLSTIYRNQKSITTKSGLLYESSIEKKKYSVKLFDNLYDDIFSDLLSYLKATLPAVVEYTEFKDDGIVPDLNYWEDIPTWMSDVEIPDWAASTAYVVDDFVKYDGAFYRCNTAHTSSTTFDNTKWDNYSTWIAPAEVSNWASNTAYNVDDWVLFDDLFFICKEAHTSGTSFNIAYWQTYYSWISSTEIEEWEPNTLYLVDDFMDYRATYYHCIQQHVSKYIENLTPSIMRGRFYVKDINYTTRKSFDNVTLINNFSFSLEER